MSELMNMLSSHGDFRRKLLTTVSVAALMVSVHGGYAASASGDDADRPVLWIELGGQIDRLDGGQVPFAPPFFDTAIKGGLESLLAAGKAPIYSSGIEGAISFMPDGSDWVFSGSVRYGRSLGHKSLHQQSKGLTTHLNAPKYGTEVARPRYEQIEADNSEKHIVVDFQAGKDAGLGMFGGESTSTVSAGVRFAQFSTRSDAAINARPDVHFVNLSAFGYKEPFPQYHEYYATAQRAARFNGVGPSILWKASAPFSGNSQNGEIVFDWGVNAAVLFGRQTAKVHHHETAQYHNAKYTAYHPRVLSYQHSAARDRNHSIAVPNVGGFAGISFRYSNAKLSLGYRGDFFFGAVDGGLDTRKSENRAFYGPFASISVGIGD